MPEPKVGEVVEGMAPPAQKAVAGPPIGSDVSHLMEHTIAAEATAPTGPSAGTWEDRGIAGKVWHPAAGGSERTRQDTTVLGIPAEMAVTGGIGVARAVAAPAANLAGRVAAGVGAVAQQGAPVLKYEVTRHLLQAANVPYAIAAPLAMIVSGYRRGTKAVSAKAAPPEAAPTPAAEPQATARAAEAEPEVGLPQGPKVPLAQAMKAVQTTAPAMKMKLTATEWQAAMQLVKEGYAPPDVLTAIKVQRGQALADSPAFANLPSDADVAQVVNEKNARTTPYFGGTRPKPGTESGNPFR